MHDSIPLVGVVDEGGVAEEGVVATGTDTMTTATKSEKKEMMVIAVVTDITTNEAEGGGAVEGEEAEDMVAIETEMREERVDGKKKMEIEKEKTDFVVEVERGGRTDAIKEETELTGILIYPIHTCTWHLYMHSCIYVCSIRMVVMLETGQPASERRPVPPSSPNKLVVLDFPTIAGLVVRWVRR